MNSNWPSKIALAGIAESGKDTVGKMLKDTGYQCIAFADPLRDLLIAINPWIYDDAIHTTGRIRLKVLVDAVGWDEAKKYSEVRRLLQDTGTGVRAIIGRTTWIKIAMHKAALLRRQGKRVLITDLRYPDDEEPACKENGFVIVKVERPGHVNSVGTAHPSESGVHRIREDALLINDSTVQDLHNKLMDDLNSGAICKKDVV